MLDDNTKSFIRFCAVGAGNTLIDFGVFLGLFYGLHVPLIPAHATGFLLAALNSYLLNKFWTFGDKSPHNPRQVFRFIVVCAAGLLLSTVVIHLCEIVMPAILAKICAIGVTIVIGYLGNRYFVFETRR